MLSDINNTVMGSASTFGKSLGIKESNIVVVSATTTSTVSIPGAAASYKEFLKGAAASYKRSIVRGSIRSEALQGRKSKIPVLKRTKATVVVHTSTPATVQGPNDAGSPSPVMNDVSTGITSILQKNKTTMKGIEDLIASITSHGKTCIIHNELDDMKLERIKPSCLPAPKARKNFERMDPYDMTAVRSTMSVKEFNADHALFLKLQRYRWAKMARA